MKDFRVIIKRQIVLTTTLYLPALDHEDAANVARGEWENGNLGNVESWVEELPHKWELIKDGVTVESTEELPWK